MIFISPVSVVILVMSAVPSLILSNFILSLSSLSTIVLTRVFFCFISHFKKPAFAFIYSFFIFKKPSSLSSLALLLFTNSLFVSFVVSLTSPSSKWQQFSLSSFLMDAQVTVLRITGSTQRSAFNLKKKKAFPELLISQIVCNSSFGFLFDPTVSL